MHFFEKNAIPTFLLAIFAVILVGLIPEKKAPNYNENNTQNNNKPAVVVGMTNTMTFTPDTVTIEVGQTVQWENTSLLAHSVTGDPSKATIEGSAQLPEGANPFDSGMMDPKETFEHTFKKAGTYKYFCIPHEGAKMYGWVIVE
jgi:plastocyanin